MESSWYPKTGRVILHVDMNAFYCSVHAAEEPGKYAGKPTAVSGSVELRRGIIVTSSYEARAKGVKTGMQVREALKLCPEIILLQPDFQLYRAYSVAFLKLAYMYSPLVEAMSIDECFVDITGSKQFGSPLQIAEELQTRIYNELHLPCSIGIAPNKLLAKMASDMKKPNGLFVLRLRDVKALLWNKPCQMLYGIGAKTADKLKVLGILTIGELASADDLLLSTHFGIIGDVLKQAANGYDDSTVNPESGASKSVGHTTTLPANLTDLSAMKKVLLNVADGVGRRLRKQKLMASTVQLTIRDPHMKTITRSVTLETCIDNTEDLYKYACHLLEKNWKKGRAVRLLGITAQNLLFKEDAVVQMDLFEYEKHPRKELLHETIDRLRDKYGEGSIVTAGMISDDPSSLIRNHKLRGTSLQMDHMKGRSLDTEDAP